MKDMEDLGNNHENALAQPFTATLPEAGSVVRELEVLQLRPHLFENEKQELVLLRRENEQLRRLLPKEGLKESSLQRVVFRQFNRFPLELRQYIYEIACLIPTVHIIGDYYRPKNRCPINVLINVCKEARAHILSLQPHYFINDSVVEEFTDREVEVGEEETSSLRNYFTPTLDTFWLVRQDMEDLVCELGSDNTWFCGSCSNILPSPSHVRNLGCQRKGDLRCLAVNINDWNNPRDFFAGNVMRGWDMGTARLIWQYRVQEVLLVVETFGEFHWEEEVRFVEPSERHREAILKKNNLWDVYFLWGEFGDGVGASHSWAGRETRSWVEDGVRMGEAFEFYRQSRVEQRRRIVDEGLVSAKELAESASLADLSDWKVPRFRFVEARKGSEEMRYTQSQKQVVN